MRRPFDFAAAAPPELETWMGLDLVEAAQDGERLLRAADGRQLALLRGGVHRSPGDRVQVSGVTSTLVLGGQLGTVVGGDFELWSCQPVWSSTVRSTGR